MKVKLKMEKQQDKVNLLICLDNIITKDNGGKISLKDLVNKHLAKYLIIREILTMVWRKDKVFIKNQMTFSTKEVLLITFSTDMDKFCMLPVNHILEIGNMEFFMGKGHIFLPINKIVKIHRKLRNMLDVTKTD